MIKRFEFVNVNKYFISVNFELKYSNCLQKKTSVLVQIIL